MLPARSLVRVQADDASLISVWFLCRGKKKNHMQPSQIHFIVASQPFSVNAIKYNQECSLLISLAVHDEQIQGRGAGLPVTRLASFCFYTFFPPLRWK